MTLTIEEENAYWSAESDFSGIPLSAPKRHPCGTCPWRVEHAETGNRHFPEPCAEVLAAAWEGYREEDGGAKDGLLVMCHRGVHSQTPPDEREFDEYCVCTAATAVQQREAIRWHERSPSGIDEEAAVRIARRMGVPERVFLARLLTRADLISRAHPAITDTRIGHPRMAPMEPGEFEPDAPLYVFGAKVAESIDPDERERINSVPGFAIEEDGTFQVEASSAEVAVEWLLARLDE